MHDKMAFTIVIKRFIMEEIIKILREEAHKFWVKHEENKTDRERSMFDRGVHSGLYLAIEALEKARKENVL